MRATTGIEATRSLAAIVIERNNLVNYSKKLGVTCNQSLCNWSAGCAAFSISAFVGILLISNRIFLRSHMFYPTQERCARSLYAIRVCVEGIAVRYSGAEGGKVFFHHPVCSLSLFYKHGPAALATSRLYTFTVVGSKRDVVLDKSTSLFNLSSADDDNHQILLQTFISTASSQNCRVSRQISLTDYFSYLISPKKKGKI